MKKFKIIKVNKGIANRFPNRVIEIHKKLYTPEYERLRKEILIHEMAHTDKGWAWRDLLLDIMGFENKWLYHKFFVTTPSSWAQLLPWYKARDGKTYYDVTLFLFYGVFLIVLGIMGMIL